MTKYSTIQHEYDICVSSTELSTVLNIILLYLPLEYGSNYLWRATLRWLGKNAFNSPKTIVPINPVKLLALSSERICEFGRFLFLRRFRIGFVNDCGQGVHKLLFQCSRVLDDCRGLPVPKPPKGQFPLCLKLPASKYSE